MPCLDKYCLLLISIGHFLKVRRAILVLLLLFSITPVNASTFSEWASQETRFFLDEYSQTLASEKNYRSNYKIGNIDPRLNLTKCSTPLSFTFQGDPLERNKNTIKVVCSDKKRWSIFVGAEINIYKEVWVASQTLPRGQRVKKSDLERAEIQVNKFRKGYFVNQQNIVGMLLRRSIQAGDVFYPGLLLPPKVVARGDTVVISALSDTISVQMMGTAMSDGKLGQQIPVKNKKSQRVVRATVISKGQVVVPM
ncbi:flagellar basal body P-ring formation chaperone FlgA [Alkalimarinus coralli]|uniref:flagellar basal body P-ring formation chaperone FlgA n=1 Tax=Alkalimarinus coralli TaxID=2935863 RepID=UPI00202B98B9|nr:flagellar basal body P-ring formation chaperone FlgA [Alkalimarinus coralli]